MAGHHGLLGRESEQQRIRELLEAAPNVGAALLIVGEPGVGKSALLANAAEFAERQGMQILRTAGTHAESHLPFAGLNQLLRPVLKHSGDLPDSQRIAILGAVGEMDVPAGDFFAVALATLSLLRDRASDSPLLILAEDAHWLDHPTLDVLKFVARRIESDSIVVAFSSRDGMTEFADTPVEQVTLSGLDDECARSLLDSEAPELAHYLRERLLFEAEGNPLALIELAAAWGRLPQATLIDTWVPVTARVERAFAATLNDLPPAGRRLLLVAAVNDGDSVDEILKAAELAAGQTVGEHELSQAVDARLIEVDGLALRFRHPLVRQAVYQAATLAERHAAHVALASVLNPERAVWHAAASTLAPSEELAAELEHAATSAQRRGTPTGALAALTRAAELSPDQAVRGRRLISAAALALALGRPEIAQGLITEAEQLELDGADRDRALWHRLQLSAGQWTDAQLQSAVEIGRTDAAFEVLLGLAGVIWSQAFDGEQLSLVRDTVESLPTVEYDPRRLFLQCTSAPVEYNARLYELIAPMLGAGLDDPGALMLLGMSAASRCFFELAAPLLEASLDGMRKQGQLTMSNDVLHTLTWVKWNLGDWRGASAVAAEAARLADLIDVQDRTRSRQSVGILAAARGDTETAEAIVSAEEHRLLPGSQPLRLAFFIRGVAAVADGRTTDAYRHFHEVRGSGELSYGLLLGQTAISWLADVADPVGRVQEVRQWVTEIESLDPGSSSPFLRANVLYARALLADESETETSFRGALEGDLCRWPFMHARLLLAHGAWLRRQRRVSEARESLKAAREAFDALGAAPWGDRAQVELRAAGERSVRRSASPIDELTPQELEIVRLAAEDRTNREIGQRLYLSHRTVGSHLYHAFPKLGISSRRELRDVLEQIAAPPAEPRAPASR